MHLHILGIAGTFMAGLAQLAKAQGHAVSGCDAAVYPPMSDQLAAAGAVSRSSTKRPSGSDLWLPRL